METMQKRDYYEVLGINKNATDEEIKKSYRKMVHKYHPDRNKASDAEDKFKEASEAYQVLSDKEKRQIYDTYGHAGESRIPGGWSDFDFGNFSDFGFGDIFGDFFGSQKKRRGSTIRLAVKISLEEAATGVKKTIRFNRFIKCKSCNGVGGKGETCPICNGYGKTRRQQQIMFGISSVITECHACHGKGIKIIKKCVNCNGHGLQQEKKTASIDIPAGIDTDESLIIEREGNQEELSNPPGNVQCIIKIEPHPIFIRKGNNILCKTKISFAQACLGEKIEVPTIWKKTVSVRIPPGTQPLQTLRIKNQGLPGLTRRGRQTARGDQLLQIEVEIPKNLSDKAKEYLMKFEEEIKGK